MLRLVALALLAGYVGSDNSTASEGPEGPDDTCAGGGPGDVGPWSCALEAWATSAHSGRHGRIMALPPATGYYVTERIDTPFLSPPPPPPAQHLAPSSGPAQTAQSHVPSSYGHNLAPSAGPAQTAQSNVPSSYGHMPSGQGHMNPSQSYSQPPQGHLPPSHGHGAMHATHALHKPQGYKEWEGPPRKDGDGKIVNRPPNPYKDKFKPSPSYPVQSQQAPGQRPNSIDRVDDPPRKQVSETDLYLLGAIEKLVYRVDLMEKRLRKMEESVHYLVAGAEAKPEPCPGNFTRVGAACYQWGEAQDWKGASLACRRQRAALLEITDKTQQRALFSKLLSDKSLKGKDFWTGGLNPGLLWIWSHSAKPVEGSSNSSSIAGEGRCLALTHDPAGGTYVYRGQDCARAHPYVCQKEEDTTKLGNDIERVSRQLRGEKARKSRLLWDESD